MTPDPARRLAVLREEAEAYPKGDVAFLLSLFDHEHDGPFHMAVAEVLIGHGAGLDQRRLERTATTWPDESDIYRVTLLRLRVLFKHKFRAEGWTPPKGQR